MASPRGTVYLLHFERPYKHARHYLGFAEDLERRLELHRAGRGARLMEVVVAAGIGFELVRTWEGDRTLERLLKNRHNAPARLCPLCRADRRGDGWQHPPPLHEVPSTWALRPDAVVPDRAGGRPGRRLGR
jgi:predicted GIY-YIG superfamily endonuclease